VESRDYTASVPCGFGPPVVTRHVLAGLHTLEEHTQCTSGGQQSWSLSREFIWGDPQRFPEPVAMVSHPGGGVPPAVYHYLPDVLGSVVGLADAAGNLVERYTYDPYGRTIILDANGTALSRSAAGNPFLWTGQRYDAVTGLYHFLFRSYSPTLGRWMQRDPAGYVDGENLYLYLNDRPLVETDPLGLFGNGSGGAGGAGAGWKIIESLKAANDAIKAARAARQALDAAQKAYKLKKTCENLRKVQEALQDYLKRKGIAEKQIQDYEGLVNTLGGSAKNVPSSALRDALNQTGRGMPKSSPQFRPPTNPPQNPPKDIPPGWRIREGQVTPQYPNGYWRLEKPMGNGRWQGINPATMRPGTHPETHVPFPPPGPGGAMP
jgi:RHS repeat-associated protein